MRRQFRENPEEARKITRLWKIIRGAIDSRQSGKVQSVLDALCVSKYARVLDASCGTGHLVPVALQDTREWYFSDGDVAMVNETASLLQTHPHLLRRLRRSFWQELHETFQHSMFNLVFVLGNSLPYACNWGDGKHEEQVREEGIQALKESFSAILSCLDIGGLFLFDLIKDKHAKYEIPEMEVDGTLVRPFVDAQHHDGIRHWSFGTNLESHTIKGLDIDFDLVRNLLLGAGFRKVEMLPKKLDIDPFCYRLCVAYK
ncbi:MAG: hypothetical protein ABII22_04850 [Candidatus Micrarchaeota archaeon]